MMLAMRAGVCTSLIAALVLLAPGTMSHAQQTNILQPGPKAQDNPALSQRDNTATDTPTDTRRVLPYLAYTLGELHYLSYACDGLDAQEWREQMVQLLEMEADGNPDLRRRLIERFNDGYRVQQRYRPLCGPEVDAERRALAHRGRDLSEMMRTAYFD